MSATAHRANTGSVTTSAASDLSITTTAPPRAESGAAGTVFRYTAAVARISLGWVFLWAFLDKTFGLGHETPSEGAWLNGGSPTSGFLGNAATGPFTDVYHSIAGAGWADVMFMLGLVTIGAALISGVAMRFAAAAGGLLLVLMWTAVLPPANNPFMDDHLIYAMVLVMLAAAGAGHTAGLGAVWERIPLVQRFAFLK